MRTKTQKSGNSRGQIAAMPKNYRPREVDFGPARGKEVWN